MAEVRTTSSTGGQKGVKLQRFDLIPIGPLTELAEHYGIGASKYANHQWRQGYEWSKSYAALMRHLTAFWAGFDFDVCSNDPEGCSHVDADGNPFVAVREDACFNHTGSHHLAAVAWHAFCLLEFKDAHPDHDDRYRPEPAEEEPDMAAYWQKVAERAERVGRIRNDVLNGGVDPLDDDEVESRGLSGKVVTSPLDEGQPLGPEWEDLGYIDGDRFPYAFEREVAAPAAERFGEYLDENLVKIQDKINEDIARLAQITATPALFIPDPPDGDWVNLMPQSVWQVPDDMKIGWRDPEPITLENVEVSTEVLRILLGLTDQPRFAVAGDGVCEEIPVADQLPPTRWICGIDQAEADFGPDLLRKHHALDWVRDYDAEHGRVPVIDSLNEFHNRG